MQLKSLSLVVATLSSMLLSSLALAHSGHGYTAGFADGFMHPATGVDHMAVAIAAGFWAARYAHHGIKDMAIFMSLFLGGMLLGLSALMLPHMQLAYPLGILLGVAFVGGIIAMPQYFAWIFFGAFALYHGFVHLLAMPAQASLFAWMAGLFIATCLLLVFGFILRQVVMTRRHMSHDTARGRA